MKETRTITVLVKNNIRVQFIQTERDNDKGIIIKSYEIRTIDENDNCLDYRHITKEDGNFEYKTLMNDGYKYKTRYSFAPTEMDMR